MRDTDADWQHLAGKQPFFGVLATERFLLENLSDEAKDEFYASGVAEVGAVARELRGMAGGTFAPERALDFGCGVGRLTLAMTAYARSVVGVDVADAMLDVARREAAGRAVTGVEWHREIPDQRVDWVNSLIVFQHIPPERGHAIFEHLVSLVDPGGFLSIQVTFYRDRRHTMDVVRDLSDYRYDGRTVEVLSTPPTETGAMSMYDYDLNRLMRAAFSHGFESVVLRHTDHVGCHGCWIFGVRGDGASAAP